MLQMRPEMGRIIEAPSRYKDEAPKQHPATAKMDLEPSPVLGQDGIGCLRCKHCALLPHTDMAQALDTEASVPIWCGKQERRRPAHIFEPCPVADPKGQFVRAVSAQGRTYFCRKGGGDRTKAASRVELDFLRAVASEASVEVLEKLTGRNRQVLWKLARQHGFTVDAGGTSRRRRENIRKAVESLEREGSRLKAEQSAYILACQARGFWPDARCNGRGLLEVEGRAIRAEIVAAVNAMSPGGKQWNWRAIVVHAYHMSPARQRSWQQRRRAKARRVTPQPPRGA